MRMLVAPHPSRPFSRTCAVLRCGGPDAAALEEEADAAAPASRWNITFTSTPHSLHRGQRLFNLSPSSLECLPCRMALLLWRADIYSDPSGTSTSMRSAARAASNAHARCVHAGRSRRGAPRVLL